MEGYDVNIKWEEIIIYNVGLDFGFFDDCIIGLIEYYLCEIEDLINFILVLVGINFINFININVGDLENCGVEFFINVILICKKDVFWEIGFNVIVNENKII